jgi:ADP-ribose pyrophosphatase YjhB (NUDIX family)
MKPWLRRREKEEGAVERVESPLQISRPSRNMVMGLVEVPTGIILVRQPQILSPETLERRRRIYWKLPGGTLSRGERPERAIVNIVESKTGARVDHASVRLFKECPGATHYTSFYSLRSNTVKLARWNRNQEEIKIFPAAEILTEIDFFPFHRQSIFSELRRLLGR